MTLQEAVPNMDIPKEVNPNVDVPKKNDKKDSDDGSNQDQFTWYKDHKGREIPEPLPEEKSPDNSPELGG